MAKRAPLITPRRLFCVLLILVVGFQFFLAVHFFGHSPEGDPVPPSQKDEHVVTKDGTDPQGPTEPAHPDPTSHQQPSEPVLPDTPPTPAPAKKRPLPTKQPLQRPGAYVSPYFNEAYPKKRPFYQKGGSSPSDPDADMAKQKRTDGHLRPQNQAACAEPVSLPEFSRLFEVNEASDICVAILTFKKNDFLRKNLPLLQGGDVVLPEKNVFVSCDQKGGMSSTMRTTVADFAVDAHFLQFDTNSADTKQRITVHYLHALKKMASNPQCRYLSVLAEDETPSVDLVAFFAAARPLLDSDPSVFAVSGYNENGFPVYVRNASKLLRTDHMPGYGWMVSKDMFESNLKAKWPTHGEFVWDTYMHRRCRELGMQSVYPEVSRVYHGTPGATVSSHISHTMYSSIVHTSRAEGNLFVPTAIAITSFHSCQCAVYRDAIMEQLENAVVVPTIADLTALLKQYPPQLDTPLVYYYHTKPTGVKFAKYFGKLGNLLGLWWFLPRNQYHQVMELNVLGRTLYLADANSKLFLDHQPPHPFRNWDELDNSRRFDAGLIYEAWADAPLPATLLQKQSSKGESCTAACARESMYCDAAGMLWMLGTARLPIPPSFGQMTMKEPVYKTNINPACKNDKCSVVSPRAFECHTKHSQWARICPCSIFKPVTS